MGQLMLFVNILKTSKDIGSAWIIVEYDETFIHRSVDDGATWETIEAFDVNAHIISLETDSYTVWIAVPARSDHLYRSNDDGETWTKIFLPFEKYLGKITTNCQGVWICTIIDIDKAMFLSVDNGLTWVYKSIPATIDFPQIFSDKKAVWLYWPGYSDTVYRSIDDCGTWTAVSFPVQALSHNVATDTNGVWLIQNIFTKILYRSIDNGLTWHMACSLSFEMEHIETDCNGVWLASTTAKSSFLRSVDNGSTWEQMTIGISPVVIKTDCHGVWMTVDYSTKHLYKSIDDGDSWDVSSTDFFWFEGMSVATN